MNPLTPLIESIALRLHNMPEQVRMRILSEVVSDMQDYYDYLCAHDKSEKEAVQMVKNKFVFSDEDINQLRMIHTPLGSRFLDVFIDYCGGAIHYVMLGILIFFIFQFKDVLFAIHKANAFIYPVASISIIIFILLIIKFFQLFIIKEKNVNSLLWGVSGIAFLIGLDFFIALLGTYYENYMAWIKTDIMIDGLVFLIFDCVKAQLHGQSGYASAWEMYSFRNIPLISVSTFTVIISSFFWFIVYTTTQKRIKENNSRMLPIKQLEK